MNLIDRSMLEKLLNHENSNRSKIHINFAGMFSSKTEVLNDHKVHSEKYGHKSTVLAKPPEARYSVDHVRTHDDFENNQSGQKADIIIENSVELLYYVFNKLNDDEKVDRLYIDEAQFCDDGLIPVTMIVREFGVEVYLSMLNQTSQGIPFPFKAYNSKSSNNYNRTFDMGYLLAVSDDPKHMLGAFCNLEGCGLEGALKSEFIAGSKDAVEEGGEDKFRARCLAHWKPNEDSSGRKLLEVLEDTFPNTFDDIYHFDKYLDSKKYVQLEFDYN